MADESKFGQKAGSVLKCEDWEALLTDALDGLLPVGEAAAFRAHGETCPNCGDLLAHARQGQEWLGYLHTEPEIPAGAPSRPDRDRQASRAKALSAIRWTEMPRQKMRSSLSFAQPCANRIM